MKKVFHWFWKQNKEHSALSTNNKEPFWLTLCQTQSFHEVQKVPKTFKYSFSFSSRRFDTMYPNRHHTFTLSTLGLYLNQKQNRINCFHLVKSRRLKDLVRKTSPICNNLLQLFHGYHGYASSVVIVMSITPAEHFCLLSCSIYFRLWGAPAELYQTYLLIKNILICCVSVMN